MRFYFLFSCLISYSFSFIPSTTHNILIVPTTSSYKEETIIFLLIIPSFFDIDTSLSSFLLLPEVICSSFVINMHYILIVNMHYILIEGNIFKSYSNAIIFYYKLL